MKERSLEPNALRITVDGQPVEQLMSMSFKEKYQGVRGLSPTDHQNDGYDDSYEGSPSNGRP
jgi:hypothetical protein